MDSISYLPIQRLGFERKQINFRDSSVLLEKVELMIDEGEDMLEQELTIFNELHTLYLRYNEDFEVPNPSEELIIKVYKEMQMDF